MERQKFNQNNLEIGYRKEIEYFHDIGNNRQYREKTTLYISTTKHFAEIKRNSALFTLS